MFTRYQPYDDEGYFLITLKDYIGGHPLFTQPLPIYGPFYYEAVGGVLRLFGIQPTQDSGRLLTLAVWLLAAGLGGILVQRVSGNRWLAVAGQVTAFGILSTLVNEPVQPAGLTSLVVLTLLIAATVESRPRIAAAVIGGSVGALLLIKVNLGVFAGVAVMVAWAAGQREPLRRIALAPISAVLIVLPWVVTSGLLGHSWVVELAAVLSLASAAVAVAVFGSDPGRGWFVPAKWVIPGGASVVVVSLAVAVLGGTSLVQMWNRSIVPALHFPEVFTLPATVGAGYGVCAAVSLVTAVAMRGRLAALGARPAAGLLRVLLGALVWVSLVVPPLFVLTIATAWVAASPPRGLSPDRPAAGPRALMAALAVAWSLQIFPVAGTQVSIAALAMLPVGAIAIGDGVRQLRAAPDRVAAAFRSVTPPAALVASIAGLLLYAGSAFSQFAAGQPVQLPGMRLVRQPPRTAAELRGVVDAVHARCSSFITFPGMNGFYIWTGQTPPTELSSEVWWLVLDQAEQQALVERLRDRGGLCVIKNQHLIEFWAAGRPVPDRALVQFIEDDFVVAGEFGDYEVLTRRAASP